jgi:hypothetical protein
MKDWKSLEHHWTKKPINIDEFARAAALYYEELSSILVSKQRDYGAGNIATPPGVHLMDCVCVSMIKYLALITYRYRCRTRKRILT